MAVANFLCPQCVTASLTSYVVMVPPIYGVDGGLLYWDPTGLFHDNLSIGTNIVYICSNNHIGGMAKPTGV